MPYGDDIIAICQAFQRNRRFVMGHTGDPSGPKTKVTARPGPLNERVALVPICQTRRPNAKTLRYGAELAEKQKRALKLAARKNIVLIGLGQVLPEQVRGTILAGRRTDEIVRADRLGPGRGCLGRLRAAPLLRVRPPVGPTRANPLRQVPHQRCRKTAWCNLSASR